MKVMIKTVKSIYSSFKALSALSKLIIFLSSVVLLDVFLRFSISLEIALFGGGLLVGACTVFFIVKAYTPKPPAVEDKNDLVLQSLEEAVKSLKDSIDDVDLYESGTFAEMNDDVVMIPDCAVIVGKSTEESYVIPFVADQNAATPEGRAFQSALRVMKENGVKLRVLKPKSGTQQVKRQAKSHWNFSNNSDISLQFPDNFVSLN
jgi:hypothetical protein